MKKFIFGFDLPFETGTKFYGSFEEPDGTPDNVVLGMCRNFGVLESSNVDSALLAEYIRKGLRLLFLVKVDDTEHTLGPVFPVDPDKRLCYEVQAVRMEMMGEDIND